MTPEGIAMKIRIGVGFAGWPFERTQDFWEFVDLVEESGLDSIWLNDRLRNPTPALEPIAALAMIAGRTRRIKFGMSVAVLPVRDPLIAGPGINDQFARLAQVVVPRYHP
jgi:alkanesulfonate monooxygenase SsuD/methylene tetrahydromethanopterin reductase-like flavin-dependent oxidoreductase (luciferase family)